MTQEMHEVVAALNLNKVLIAILDTLGSVTVPTLTFIDAATADKELVVTYDEDTLSFIFSLKDKVNGEE